MTEENKKIAEGIRMWFMRSGVRVGAKEFEERIESELNKTRLQTFKAMKERCKEIAQNYRQEIPRITTCDIVTDYWLPKDQRPHIAEAIDKIKFEDLG